MTVYADETLILTTVRDRLRLKVSGFSTSTCFICDTPVPDVLPPQVPICTICIGDAYYDEATFMGAGPNAVCENSTLILTLLNRCVLDPPPKCEDALIHASRGLLSLKRAVLSAVLLSDARHCEGYADQWAPDEGYGYFLVERGFIPRGWSAPRYVDRGGHQYLGTSLTLSFSFDQDLLF